MVALTPIENEKHGELTRKYGNLAAMCPSRYNQIMANIELGEFSLDRMERAIELVRERLMRSTAALDRCGIPHAVVGGCAVAHWVSSVDESAARYSNDVDILIRRQDLPKVTQALKTAGFLNYPEAADVFIESPDVKLHSAVKFVFAGEMQHSGDFCPVPDVDQSERSKHFQVLSLEPLVRMGLAAYRREDRMLLRDMLDVGLMDESWLATLPIVLAARLKELIDTPDG